MLVEVMLRLALQAVSFGRDRGVEGEEMRSEVQRGRLAAGRDLLCGCLAVS